MHQKECYFTRLSTTGWVSSLYKKFCNLLSSRAASTHVLSILDFYYTSHIPQGLRFHFYLFYVGTWACMLAVLLTDKARKDRNSDPWLLTFRLTFICGRFKVLKPTTNVALVPLLMASSSLLARMLLGDYAVMHGMQFPTSLWTHH